MHIVQSKIVLRICPELFDRQTRIGQPVHWSSHCSSHSQTQSTLISQSINVTPDRQTDGQTTYAGITRPCNSMARVKYIKYYVKSYQNSNKKYRTTAQRSKTQNHTAQIGCITKNMQYLVSSVLSELIKFEQHAHAERYSAFNDDSTLQLSYCTFLLPLSINVHHILLQAADYIEPATGGHLAGVRRSFFFTAVSTSWNTFPKAVWSSVSRQRVLLIL